MSGISACTSEKPGTNDSASGAGGGGGSAGDQGSSGSSGSGTAGGPAGGSSGTGATGGTTSGGTTGNGGSSAGTTAGGSGGSGGSNGGGTAGSGGGSGGSGGAGAGGDPGGGGVSGSAMGGTAGSGGGSSGGKSDLPVPPTSGVPRPSGAPGGMRVLDWAGFRGAVSYTFDDSNSSQIQNYAALNALGVRFTFYLQTGKQESQDAIWMTARDDGHELGNHSRNHSSQDDGSDTDAATQFIESRFGVKVYTMAAPNGSGVYTDIARTRFLINRGVSNAVIVPNGNADPFTLPCYVPPEGASASVMNAEVDSARSAGGWRVLLVHGFTGGTDGAYRPVALSEFLATVEHAKSFGDLWIDSVVNIGAYWRAQKAVSGAQPTTSGDETTWTWTLPDHFPPGQYLRVTVDGGTLSQNGAPLAWHEHGYYEVALDVGSMTLGP